MEIKVHSRRPNQTRRVFLQRSSMALAGLACGGFPLICRANRGDVLHIRNYADVFSLDPVNSISFAEGHIFGAIYQNVLQFKPMAAERNRRR
jgi:hypothetical protein